MNKKYTLLFILLLNLLLVYSYFKDLQKFFAKEKEKKENDFIDENYSRDFYRYYCKNRVRIGGLPEFIRRVPHKLYRTEGAWFICQDQGVGPIQNDCLVLSFGINNDPSFDAQMYEEFKCRVESFDPFVEAEMFKRLRKNSDANINEVSLKVNDKWTFHRIGLIGNLNSVKNVNEIGWMSRLDDIINYTMLNNKVIDIFKMDIESGEWEFLLHIDINFLCKNVKQFMLETHTPKLNPKIFDLNLDGALKVLRKLEKCFRLFHRDTRFYRDNRNGLYGFWKSEFQEPYTHKIDVGEYKSELKLIDFMVTYGELYFVNKNFLVYV